MKLRSSSSAGFTLIELLVVLGIMGLILASAVLARPKNAVARVERTARSMAATFQLARSRAMAANTDVVVAIDPVNGEFGYRNAMHKLPKGMSMAVTIAETERLGDTGALRFFPDGQSSGADILLSYQGHTRRIAVNWFTGEPVLGR
ncbi:GspH/FimT family pseudopilin [Bradyrhizobium diazoefficiens]|uniref:GspH/FimT family pseudopilin n=1 Tax=Bradyrhizobium diazoefficiens TaxID=1355477 RepID=UPI00190C222D|nr:GspH/FimT family pseudopilin [Bradyrhizobium diazoefficiens]MBK3665374.1 GspH/FimT family pseudopilin [Bradyrhizobium diazoefficiens]